MEQWKDIAGYEGLYKVSNLGNILSTRRSKLLKKTTDNYGYHVVGLSGRYSSKVFKVHRLVARAFLEDYSDNLQVNHKNEIKTDNQVSNLEMCDNKYNCNYGSRKTTLAKPIIQETLNGEFVKEWKSLQEIEKTLGFCRQIISSCCKGFQKDNHRLDRKVYPVHQAYNYKWKFKHDK